MIDDSVVDDLISERVHGGRPLETLGVSDCITIQHPFIHPTHKPCRINNV